MYKSQTTQTGKTVQTVHSTDRKIVFFLAVGASILCIWLRAVEAETVLPEPPFPPVVNEPLPTLVRAPIPPPEPPPPIMLPHYAFFASSPFTFAQTLAKGYGSLTFDVLALQHILFDQGYLALLPTGYFGNRTEGAVKKFQAAHGIDQTGIVGAATRKALNAFWQ